MTLGECMRRAGELVFSYSVAGSEIPLSYNNQADYVSMIPGLVNQAEIDIATTAKRIYADVPVSELEKVTVNNETRYKLPDDCWMPLTSGLRINAGHGRSGRYDRFRLLGGKYLIVPESMEDRLTLEYWRYPARVSESTDMQEELDNTPDTHEAVVFYVAAHLLMYDDTYRYALLENEYELKKSRLKEPVWVEQDAIWNRYET